MITTKKVMITMVVLAVVSTLTWAADTPEKISPVVPHDTMQLLGDLSPEQLEQLVKAAAASRLRLERLTVSAEILQNILYDETDIDKAVKILQAGKKKSQQDNIRRICKAFAIVDGRFAEPFDMYEKEKYAESAKTLKTILNPENATYLSAAMHYIHADSLYKAGRSMDAAEAYSEILVNMPDRLSFAADSASKAAKIYEKIGRNYYAMQMYIYALNNYSLTMSRAELEKILEKVRKFRAIYADPMKAVAGMMKAVEKRLADEESGKKTQDSQQQIVSLLEDLIKTAEESRRQKDKQQQKQQQRQRRKSAGEKQASGKKANGKSPGKAANPQNPSSPANESTLVPGPVTRPNKLSQKHQAKGVDKWAELPPRQRQKIESMMRLRLKQSRGDLVREYHKKLAESE